MSRRDGIASCMYAVLSAIVIICMAVVVVLLSGCKVIKEVPVEKIVEKTSYQDRVFRDSIYLRDSIRVETKGDTVFRDRYRYLYRDREIRDTLQVTVIDSIPYPVEVEKRLSRWEEAKMKVGGFAIPFIFVLLFIAVGWIVRKATS